MAKHAQVLPSTALSNAVAVVTGKGGSGKTSVSAHLAGLAAERGYNVLLVDIDPQANAGRDLGYFDTDVDDKGAGLFEAVTLSRPMRVLHGVRPNLDVVCGGSFVEHLGRMAWEATNQNAATAVRNALFTVAEPYDLVVIDTPPGDRFLRESALTAARFALIPTRTDEASIDGVTRIAEDFGRVQENNPALELLGVVLFGANPSATAILRRVRDQLARGLDGVAPVFDTVIRYLEAPAVEARAKGMLVHEYARDIVDTAPRWFERKSKDVPRVASTAHKLAEDYVNLTAEVLTAMAAHLDDAEGGDLAGHEPSAEHDLALDEIAREVKA